jgi:3-methyladenine DNA glycosylase/8-oxoguanine DNA glycosylase
MSAMTPKEKRAQVWREATAALRLLDPKLRRWIDRQGPIPDFQLAGRGDPYLFLVRSIVSQQLSSRVADVIFGRLVGLFEKKGMTIEALALMDRAKIRGAGLSENKTNAVLDLAAHILSNKLPRSRDFHRIDDETLITQLVEVKGIGRWTAENFMIFRLGRLDVLPVDDLVIRKGYARVVLGKDGLPPPKEIRTYGERWRPYRTVASKLLWASMAEPSDRD